MELVVCFTRKGKLEKKLVEGFSSDPAKDLQDSKFDTSLEIMLDADRRSTILAVVK